jgi:mannosyltransferase
VSPPAPDECRRPPAHWPARLAVGAATVVNLVLALYHLGGRSLWTDELTTWQISGQPVHAVLSTSGADGGHLVVYYLIVHLVIGLFGAGADALRAPSVVFGVAAVPLMYLLGRRLGPGPVPGVLAAALFAVSTPLVYWEQNARDYSLVVLLAVASTLALVVAVQSGRTSAVAAWTLLTAATCYTHEQGVLLLLAQLPPVLLWPAAAAIRRRLLLALALLAVAGIPPTLSALHHPQNQDFLLPADWAVVREVMTFLASGAGTPRKITGIDHLLLIVTAVGWVAALALLAAGLLRNGRDERSFALALTLSWLVVPTAAAWAYSHLEHPVLLDRYVIVSLPPAALALALVVTRVEARAAGLLGFAYLMIFRFGVLAPTYDVPQDDFAPAVAYVVQHTNAGDCIIFQPNADRAAFDYYATRQPGGEAASLPVQILPAGTAQTKVAAIGRISGVSQADVAFNRIPIYFLFAHNYCPRVWTFVRHVYTTAATPTDASLPYLRHELAHYYAHRSRQSYHDITVTVYSAPRPLAPRPRGGPPAH